MQILIPLHRARNLQPGDEYVQDRQLYRIDRTKLWPGYAGIQWWCKATVTPLPAPKLTLPGKP